MTGPLFAANAQTGLIASIKYEGEPVERKMVEQLNGKFQNWTRNMPPVESIQIDGEFHAEQAGFYQMAISTKGKINIAIDDRQFSKAAPEGKYGLIYIPISLGQGWHRISIKPHPSGMDRLTLLLSGGQVPAILGGNQVRNSMLPEEPVDKPSDSKQE